jgi:hypothetical protein
MLLISWFVMDQRVPVPGLDKYTKTWAEPAGPPEIFEQPGLAVEFFPAGNQLCDSE